MHSPKIKEYEEDKAREERKTRNLLRDLTEVKEREFMEGKI